jgi:cytochrome c peroxidase
MDVRRFIIHPAYVVESAAAFTHDVQAVRESELKRLVKAIKAFFKSFENQDFRDLSEGHIQKLLDTHRLSVGHLLDDYCKKLKNLN